MDRMNTGGVIGVQPTASIPITPTTMPQQGQELPMPAEEKKQSSWDEERIRKVLDTLHRYKTGKRHLEDRVVGAENWWRMYSEYEEQRLTNIGLDGGFICKSARLHDSIVNKHADYMDAAPEPNILPREPADKGEARKLSSIIPCILEQNDFEQVYSDVGWQKLKTGTGVYMVTWDARKNGLGDIDIRRVDLLNLFWKPKIRDIQDSPYVFYTYLQDIEELVGRYPELEQSSLRNGFEATRFLYDESVDTSDMATVVNVYYKKSGQLHYAKIVGDKVVYASEDEGKPIYRHGLYPFVFDTLFPDEESICGRGYIDIGANVQTQIDLTRTALLKNAMVNTVPRVFSKIDGSINEGEYLDLNKAIVHVNGPVDETNIRVITGNSLNGNYLSMQELLIAELRETTGNTEAASGAGANGATAASAIAALQEASGKTSRDSTKNSWRAYKKLINLVIELIREFYDQPRMFRILGNYGTMEFTSYSNEGLQAQPITVNGLQVGMREPVLDIKIVPEKQSSFTKLSQNELALQFYGQGFFNPQNTDQSLMVLDMMDFVGKEEMQQKIANMGTMYQKLIQYQQLALTLAAQYKPELVQGLAASITGDQSIGMRGSAGIGEVNLETDPNAEGTKMKNARARAQQATQPT